MVGPSARSAGALARRRGALLGLVAILLACGADAELVGEAGVGAAGVAGSTSAPAPQRAAAMPPPDLTAAAGGARDVVLVTIDTLRFDALGFAGNRRAATPALDAVAAAGAVFEQARAHNLYTLPSHANILTGRLPFEHGVRDNAGFVLPASVPTVATILREAGFATAAVIGAFPLDARYGLARGFDVYDDAYPEGAETAFALPERRGREVVERGLAWWREHASRRRFLWLHLFDPHAPYAAEAPWGAQFAADPYLGEVAAVDAYLAPLLREVASPGSLTLLVVTSDHGEALGDHGEQTHGLFAYDATLRVPLVLHGPGVVATRADWPARHVDLVPTMLDALGREAPPELSGRSLLRLAGPGAGEPPSQYFESLAAVLTRDWAPLRGVVDGGLKYIELPLPELYDLRADPAEAANLVASRSSDAARLRGLLPRESVWPPAAGAVSAEERAALQSLGYLVGGEGERAAREYTAADDPKNLVALNRDVHRFVDLFQSRRLDEAQRLAEAVVRARPGMALGHYHLAQVLLEQGRVDEALRAMAGAVERGVATDPLRRQLALTLAEVGRPLEAVAVLEPLEGTGDPDTLAALGLARSEAGDQARARATLERVFERDPRHPTARLHLALVAVREGRFAEAERQARRALEINHGLSQAWNILGVAVYNQGRPAEALRSWEEALVLAPGDFDVLYNVALVAAESGERELAIRSLRRFLAEAPPQRYGADLEKARARLRALEPR